MWKLWGSAEKELEASSMWTILTSWLLAAEPTPEPDSTPLLEYISHAFQLTWSCVYDTVSQSLGIAWYFLMKVLNGLCSVSASVYEALSTLIISSYTTILEWWQSSYPPLLAWLQVHQYQTYFTVILLLVLTLTIYYVSCYKQCNKKLVKHKVSGTDSQHVFRTPLHQSSRENRTPNKRWTDSPHPSSSTFSMFRRKSSAKKVIDISSSDESSGSDHEQSGDVLVSSSAVGSAFKRCSDSSREDLRPSISGLQRNVATILFVGFLCSFPWEFMRIYQKEVAKKAATTLLELPAECQSPQQMSMWRWLVQVAVTSFSWEQTPCHQYHEAHLVDPFWEVTPLVVLCSLVTRCILTPLEALCTGIGEGLRLLLHKVPWQWQPLVMVLIATVIIISVAICCRYRIVFPLLVSLEPMRKTPVVVRFRPKYREIGLAAEKSSSPRKSWNR